MSIKISPKKNLNEKNIKNYVLFSDEDFKISQLSNLSLNKYSTIISKSIKSFNQKEGTFLSFNLNPDQKIILVKLDKNLSASEIEKRGAELYTFLKKNNIFEITFILNNAKEHINKNKFFLDEFLHGVNLKSYEFNKYKTKKKEYLT